MKTLYYSDWVAPHVDVRACVQFVDSLEDAAGDAWEALWSECDHIAEVCGDCNVPFHGEEMTFVAIRQPMAICLECAYHRFGEGSVIPAFLGGTDL